MRDAAPAVAWSSRAKGTLGTAVLPSHRSTSAIRTRRHGSRRSSAAALTASGWPTRAACQRDDSAPASSALSPSTRRAPQRACGRTSVDAMHGVRSRSRPQPFNDEFDRERERAASRCRRIIEGARRVAPAALPNSDMRRRRRVRWRR